MTETELLTKRIDALADVVKNQRDHLVELHRLYEDMARRVKALEDGREPQRKPIKGARPRRGD